MNLKITVLLVFLSCAYTNAQETFRISGILKAAETNTPISYANAVLVQDDEVFKGDSSDDSGAFVISDIPKGNYTLRISYLGFKTYSKEITLTENSVLGTIFLEKSDESLNDVTVVSKKPILKREIDRLVFSIQGTALTEGNTWDVLRRTPGVIVINNNVTVKNSTPIIYINNRRVYLSNDEIYLLLEGTPATNITAVEVITNPPARYDAQGGTVLNIVMTKNMITGYHGSIFGNYTQGVFPRYNGGTNHFYKHGKFNLFANYSYTDNRINRDNDETINYLENGNTTSVWNSLINRNTSSNQHNFSTNIDYEIDARNTISFSGNLLYLPYWKRFTSTRTTVDDLTSANEDFSLVAKNNSARDQHNIGLNLDYVHRFKKDGEKLSLNVHYTDYKKADDQHVRTEYDVVSGQDFTTAFSTFADQETNIFSGQFHYELPIDETATFEAGAKAADIKTNSNLQQFTIENGVSTLDVSNSNVFDYDETIYAAYVSYAKSWEKFSFKLGVRGEQTEVRGFSQQNNEANAQNYFELFPTANTNYQISNKFGVYAEYSRRIQRPSFEDLNPFRYNFTDFSFVSGNPALQPAISNKYKVGFSINRDYFIEAYYNYTKNAIYELTLQNNDDEVLQYVSSNVENNIEYGLDFSAYFSITNTWNVSFVTSVFNGGDTFTIANQETTQRKWGNYTSIDQNFTFLKDQSLTANLSYIYISSLITGLSEVSERNFLNLALRKSFWDNKMVLSLSLNDILNGQEFTNTTRFVNQNSRYFSNYDTQTVRIGFRYNFGNTKLQTNQRSKSSAERERLKKKE